MERDFSKNSLEYNDGFINGLLWVLSEITPMVEDILKANNEIINDEEDISLRLE